MYDFLSRLSASLARRLEQPINSLQQNFDNQSAAINSRLDRLIDELSYSREAPPPSLLQRPPTTGSNKLAVPEPYSTLDLDADISLIEQFSFDWSAHALEYPESLGKLRIAAQRLLPMLLESAQDSTTFSLSAPERLRRIGDDVACLARRPLFYPDMFQGVALLPDGNFEALSSAEAQHIRASGLLGPEDRAAVREVYEKLFQGCTAPLKVVEIGSAAGRGSTRIAGEYVKRTHGTLYCIDPYNDPAWGTKNYFAFLANLQIFDLESTVVPLRCFSVEAAALFDDGSLDAAFIDGSHIYPNVLADIDAYLPKIRKGGYIFGHDLHDVPSRFDRDELLRNSDRNNTKVSYKNSEGHLETVDAHSGVILAVQDRFGDDVRIYPGSVVWSRQV
jgi:predicted O-methyltransferase YrrM